MEILLRCPTLKSDAHGYHTSILSAFCPVKLYEGIDEIIMYPER
jgi:hypothetical protein